MMGLLMLAQAAVTPLPMPAFLSGCWEQRTEAGRWTEECWTDTRGGLMIGSGRDGKLTAWPRRWKPDEVKRPMAAGVLAVGSAGSPGATHPVRFLVAGDAIS